MKRALIALGCLIGALVVAQEQKAQPPPDFTSGYVLPQTPAPLPRAEIWQAIDVGVLVLVLALGAAAVLTKRSRLEVRLLALFSLAYFGFYKLGCVCSIGSIQNVAYAATHPDYTLPWTVAAFFLIPLGVALFLGRIFCGTACPMGALQDLLLIRPVNVPGWLSGPLGAIPYLYLGSAVLYATTGTAFLICELDPFVALYRMSGPITVVVFGAVLLTIGLFVGRPYCRFLCPYGVLLRWASLASKFRVSISPSECVNCHLCASACPYGAIEPPVQREPISRRRTAWMLACLPVLVALFALDGCRLAPTLAATDNRVVRALEIQEESDKPKPAVRGAQVQGARTPYTGRRAQAWRDQRQPAADAVLQARRVEADFRTGATWLGVWFGLVIGLRALLLARRRSRTGYEAEPGACVACARCYASCPVENRPRFERLGNLLEGPG